MTLPIRVHPLDIRTMAQAKQALDQIGCNAAGVQIMKEKAVYRVLRISHIRSKAANLLKQTFLGKGGEVAVSGACADLREEYTDALIFATLRQYRQALPQLRLQPWGLAGLADAIEAMLASSGLPRRIYHWRDRSLTIDARHSLVMGILNLTPDSFSDGGKYSGLDEALRHVEQMQADGADIIDIGAESTRPYQGAKKVTAIVEMERLCPILAKVLPQCSVPISVDTYKASVAEAALACGAHMINDIWGLQFDPLMAEVAARYDVPVVVMHNADQREYPHGVMEDILLFLQKSIAKGIEQGIKCENIIVDPGIGFSKTAADNLEVMSRLDEMQSLGCPVLLGTSRKRFIGQVLDLPVDDRLEGTIATAALGKTKGVQIHRVHDVKEIKRTLKMMDAMMGAERNDKIFD